MKCNCTALARCMVDPGDLCGDNRRLEDDRLTDCDSIIADTRGIGLVGCVEGRLTAGDESRLALINRNVDLFGSILADIKQQGTRSDAIVFVVSNPIVDGNKPDTAGQQVKADLEAAGFTPIDYQLLAEAPEPLQAAIDHALADGCGLIVTVGGTGIGPKDKVVETVEPLLTTPMPGLMETARAFGQRRSPQAVMSRGVAGFIGDTLALTFPGSRAGAEETMTALLPSLVHILKIQARFASGQ